MAENSKVPGKMGCYRCIDLDRTCSDLQRQLQQAQGELLVAKRNADSWQETAQQAQEER